MYVPSSTLPTMARIGAPSLRAAARAWATSARIDVDAVHVEAARREVDRVAALAHREVEREPLRQQWKFSTRNDDGAIADAR